LPSTIFRVGTLEPRSSPFRRAQRLTRVFPTLTFGGFPASKRVRIPLHLNSGRFALASTQNDFQVLAVRVEKLEASARLWKIASGVLLLSGISLLLMGAKPADRVDAPVLRATSVEAQEFILKGEDGRVYARLSLSSGARPMQLNGRSYMLPNQKPQNEAALEFFDERGQVLWSVPANPALVPAK
jgi:hypothetical protein